MPSVDTADASRLSWWRDSLGSPESSCCELLVTGTYKCVCVCVRGNICLGSSADVHVVLSCPSEWWWLERVRSCIAPDPSANILMLRLQFLPCALSFPFPGLVNRPTGGGFQLLLLSLGQLQEWLSISWWLDVTMSLLHLPLSRKQSSWLTWSTRRGSEEAATQLWQVFITQDCSWQKGEVKKSFKNNRKSFLPVLRYSSNFFFFF